MSDELQNLKNYIRELVNEVEEELEEATATGNVAGYQTPNAFGDDSKKSKKKTKDVATQAGYTVVEDDIRNINEAEYKHPHQLRSNYPKLYGFSFSWVRGQIPFAQYYGEREPKLYIA